MIRAMNVRKRVSLTTLTKLGLAGATVRLRQSKSKGPGPLAHDQSNDPRKFLFIEHADVACCGAQNTSEINACKKPRER